MVLPERPFHVAKPFGEGRRDHAVAGIVRVDAVADVGRLRGGLRRGVDVDVRQRRAQGKLPLPGDELPADDAFADREGVLLHERGKADDDVRHGLEIQEVGHESLVVALHARAVVRVPVDGLAVVRAEHEEDDVGLGGLRLFELGRLAVAHAALSVPLLALVQRRAGVVAEVEDGPAVAEERLELRGVALFAAVRGAVAVGDAVADAGDDERVGGFAGEGGAGGERGAEGEEAGGFHGRGSFRGANHIRNRPRRANEIGAVELPGGFW